MTLPFAITMKLGPAEVELRGDRTLYWPAEDALLVADVHLGKEAHFQAHGVPVPSGGLQDTLGRLTLALDDSEARRLIVLGDLIHHRDCLGGATGRKLATWLDDTEASVLLVAGNHDRGAHRWLADQGVTVTADPLIFGDLLLHHGDQPLPPTESSYAVAGHLHPTVRIKAAGDSLRLPCFCMDPHRALLPAFTEFSNGPALPGRPGRRFVAVADGGLLELPPATLPPSRHE